MKMGSHFLIQWLKSRGKIALGALILLCGRSLAPAQLQSIPVTDTSFQPQPGAKLPIAFQADGKILVSGNNFLVQGTNQNGIVRLNADGSLDATFAAGTGADASTISLIVVQADQKILVGGSFTSFSGTAASGLVRLNTDGKLDSGFAYDGPNNVTKVALSTTGDLFILANDASQIRRHSSTGTTKLLLSRAIQPIPPQGDPISGYTTRFPDGSPATIDGVRAIDVAELSNGTILGAFYIYDNNGDIYEYDDTISVNIYAYNADNTFNSTWPTISPVPTYAAQHTGYNNTAQIIPRSSGDFFVLGSAYDFNKMPPFLGLFKADGSADSSFAPSQVFFKNINLGAYIGQSPSGALDSTGLLVLSGSGFSDPAYPSDFWTTVRLLANGSIDPTFGINASTLFGGVKKGATPADDRLFLYLSDKGALGAYKFTNTLALGAASALPSSQTVTTGKGISIAAPLMGTNIQWQVSSDSGSSWTNLTNDGTYQGTTTATLTITSATAAMNANQYRYVSTSTRGTVNSTATTLAVAPLFFPFPASIGIDASGNLYVGDTSTQTIMEINPNRQVSSFVGSRGLTGTTDGSGQSALFNQPGGLTINSAGALTVSDTANGTLRSITTAGVVTTLAGSSASRGSADGVGTAALFSAPIGIAQYSTGTFFVADSTNHTIRMVTPSGTVTTFAGTAGNSGASDGTGVAARFNNPTGVAVDGTGNVYVSDTTNNLIRKISPSGVVTTLAGVTGIAGSQDGIGSGALFNQPGGLTVDFGGNVYVADTGNSAIRKISPTGVVTTLAGLPTVGGLKDGTGTDAWFNQPKSLTIDSAGNLYVADTGNAAIREVTPAGVVTTLPLSAPVPTITTQPSSVTITAGGNASFSVTATSSSPLTYQWQKDGTNISGATAATYSISAASTANAGSYTVVVTNFVGSVTSTAATLTVNSAPPPPPPPASGGGGGGAPSVWFVGALSFLVFVRRVFVGQEPNCE
jgi:uncharacterized delta-60 repeat protein